MFARHWIDTGKLTARAINGVVHVRGKLEYRAAKARAAGPIKPDFILQLEKELKGIPKVRMVRFNFDEWEHSAFGWKKTGRNK